MSVVVLLTVLRSAVGDDDRTQKHQKQCDAGHYQRGPPGTRRDGRVFVNPGLVYHVLIVSWYTKKKHTHVQVYIILLYFMTAVIVAYCSDWWPSGKPRLRLPVPPWRLVPPYRNTTKNTRRRRAQTSGTYWFSVRQTEVETVPSWHEKTPPTVHCRNWRYPLLTFFTLPAHMRPAAATLASTTLRRRGSLTRKGDDERAGICRTHPTSRPNWVLHLHAYRTYLTPAY